MKFAKYLTSKAVPDWRTYYLDYKRLKKLLEPYVQFMENSTETSNSQGHPVQDFDGSTVEKLFQAGFKEEVDKVEFFCSTRLKQCRARFQAVTVQFFELKYPTVLSTKAHSPHLKATQINDSHHPEGLNGSMNLRRQASFRSRSDSVYEKDSLECLSSSLHDLAAVLKHLMDNFIPLNKLAVYKIFKKHDKLCTRLQNISPNFIPRDDLALSELLLQTSKNERKFYYRYKEDISQLLAEVQHLQHEFNRLLIRKRQEGIV